MKPLFPYFGGKSAIAEMVWERFGDPGVYIEPFCGSAAMLLARPQPRGHEVINDSYAFIPNFYRAVQQDCKAVIAAADWPVMEVDYHARHRKIHASADGLKERLEADPGFYDPQIAGWWLYGMKIQIGRDFMRDVNLNAIPKIAHPARFDAGLISVVAERLKNINVLCGDWKRPLGMLVNKPNRITAVFLDPPYAGYEGVYGAENIAADVMNWAIEYGAKPLMRIALCGYEGDYVIPDSWECVAWKANGGYSNYAKTRNNNKHRERVWFSPSCAVKQKRLFSLAG